MKYKGKHYKQDRKRSFGRELLSWVLCIILAVAAALLLRLFVLELVKVDGDSMLPTLQSHQTVFVEKVTRYFDSFDRGEIVIVHYPERDGAYVKRVVGLPGDTVEIREGKLCRNGQTVEESYLAGEDGSLPYMEDFGPVTVPEGSLFVMGDNRNNSMDSRDPGVGPIAKDQVIGHALFVIWPIF